MTYKYDPYEKTDKEVLLEILSGTIELNGDCDFSKTIDALIKWRDESVKDKSVKHITL